MTEVNPYTKKEVKKNGYGKVSQLQIGLNVPVIVASKEIVKILKLIVDKDGPDLLQMNKHGKLEGYLPFP